MELPTTSTGGDGAESSMTKERNLLMEHAFANSSSAGPCSPASNVTSQEMSTVDVPCQTKDIIDLPLREEEEEAHKRSSRIVRFDSATMSSSSADDVDTLDTPATMEPLHVVGSTSSLEDLLPPPTQPALRLPVPVTPRHKLTLSAFHWPEQAVRLTDCDATRLLEKEYNLRAHGCRVIGHGAFSTVRLAVRESDGKQVAIKSISKFDALRARRLRRGGSSTKHLDEWEVLKLLETNPYVLTLFDVFETEHEIHLVTDYCEGGELFDAIKRKGMRRNSFRRGRFSEAQASRITNQVLCALVELHSHGIVHRDVKAENILLLHDDDSDIQVKLCDFGMARLYSDEGGSSDGESSPSTPGLEFSSTSPPEVCRNKGAFGPAADVYSVGVTLYILLCGFPPVFCENDLPVFPEAYWQDISPEAKSVVKAMLHPNPSERITTSAALQDAWIRQQTTRVRRGSIAANLELVRSKLFRSMGESTSPKKRSRRSSLTFMSPKQRRLSMDISLTELYAVSEKGDVRVIEDRVETSTPSELRGQKLTC